jgi:hypothetical protein
MIMNYQLLTLITAIAYFNFGIINDDIDPGTSATAFINSLTAEQKEQGVLALEDSRRLDWHFFPSSMFDREGVSLAELNGGQKELLYAHLRNSLSASGYERVHKIMGLEAVLREMGQDPEFRDPEKYFVAFYGHPEKDNIWAWSFEGHHISLNFTVAGDKVAFTPKFWGANPAEVRLGSRKGERVLGREEDYGFSLLNSFGEKHKNKAIFSDQTFGDIVTMVLDKVDPSVPQGLSMQEMSEDQQKLLRKIIDQYLVDMPEAIAKWRKGKLEKESAADIYFGWAGSVVKGKPHYYRIQGKTFMIEFDNSQNEANHIHTVWRDFDGDFGRDLIKEHYQKDH